MTVDHRWYSVLDDLDAHLREQEDALDAGLPDLVVAFALPPGLGSVPPNLEYRLEIMRRRGARIESALSWPHEIGRRLVTLPRVGAVAKASGEGRGAAAL
jgi:hypothetical protein